MLAFAGIGLYRSFCDFGEPLHTGKHIACMVPLCTLVVASRLIARAVRLRYSENGSTEDDAEAIHTDPDVRYRCRLLRSNHLNSLEYTHLNSVQSFSRQSEASANKEPKRRELGEWRECACEAEDEGGGIIASFVLYKIIMFAVFRRSSHELVEDVSSQAEFELAGAALLVVLFIFVATLFKRKVEGCLVAKRLPPTHRTIRRLQVAQLTANLTMSWMAFTFFHWWSTEHFPKASHELVEIIAAAILTAAAVGAILVLDKVADCVLGDPALEQENRRLRRENSQELWVENTERAIRMVIEAVALAVGLSWEKAFHAALEVIVESNEFMEKHYVISRGSLALLNCLIIVPAWLKFIVPNATKTAEDHKKLMEESSKM